MSSPDPEACHLNRIPVPLFGETQMTQEDWRMWDAADASRLEGRDHRAITFGLLDGCTSVVDSRRRRITRANLKATAASNMERQWTKGVRREMEIRWEAIRGAPRRQLLPHEKTKRVESERRGTGGEMSLAWVRTRQGLGMNGPTPCRNQGKIIKK